MEEEQKEPVLTLLFENAYVRIVHDNGAYSGVNETVRVQDIRSGAEISISLLPPNNVEGLIFYPFNEEKVEHKELAGVHLWCVTPRTT